LTIGRNDPCHCGSGRKYKRCHYAADSAAAAQTSGEQSPVHDIDQRVVDDILTYVQKRFPTQLLQEVDALQTHPQMSPQLMMPWLAYVSDFEGRTAVEWYLEERGWSLSRGVREWLEAQQKSWLSVWEIIDLEHGRSLTLRDMLSGEERLIHEVSGSKNAERHLALLGRVVDAGDVSLMCGMHSVPLRPSQGAEVVAKVRRTLRRRTSVPIERLRNARISWRMLNAWSDGVDLSFQRPALQNTDGDPILFVEDRWNFSEADRERLIERLGSIENVAPEQPDESEVDFIFSRAGNPMHKDWDNTTVGSATLTGTSLIAQTNSLARADSLQVMIESASGELLGRRVRSVSDPVTMIEKQRELPDSVERPASSEDTSTPEMNEIVRESKERHYAQWLDDSIPALGGRTPREAARTKRGREQLDALLKDVELIECKQPEAVRFNVRKLRRALGLPV
jgi:SEC-C motif